MEHDELERLERSLGPLPRDYREFLASYPHRFRRPVVANAPPLAHRLPGDSAPLQELNEADWTSSWRERQMLVVGTNGTGDPYLIFRNGEPGVFIGNHEVEGASVTQVEENFRRFVAALEAEALDGWRERCLAEGRTGDALRLADAAVAAWKVHGKGARATKAARARATLRKLTDPKQVDARLRSLLGKDPAKAAAALASATNGAVAAVVGPIVGPRSAAGKCFASTERARWATTCNSWTPSAPVAV